MIYTDITVQLVSHKNYIHLLEADTPFSFLSLKSIIDPSFVLLLIQVSPYVSVGSCRVRHWPCSSGSGTTFIHGKERKYHLKDLNS